MNMEPTQKNTQSPSPRKPYSTPKLTCFGTVFQMTQFGPGENDDGALFETTVS